MSKKSYIFTREESSKRGFNVYISVYRITRNIPHFIGDTHVNTASYYGDRATACQIISEVENMKMRDSYNLVTDIHLNQV